MTPRHGGGPQLDRAEDPGKQASGTGSTWLPASWKGRAVLVSWVLALGIWLQFSLASVDELELQAASLGGIVVVILLVAGAAVWMAKTQTRDPR